MWAWVRMCCEGGLGAWFPCNVGPLNKLVLGCGVVVGAWCWQWETTYARTVGRAAQGLTDGLEVVPASHFEVLAPEACGTRWRTALE